MVSIRANEDHVPVSKTVDYFGGVFQTEISAPGVDGASNMSGSSNAALLSIDPVVAPPPPPAMSYPEESTAFSICSSKLGGEPVHSAPSSRKIFETTGFVTDSTAPKRVIQFPSRFGMLGPDTSTLLIRYLLGDGRELARFKKLGDLIAGEAFAC